MLSACELYERLYTFYGQPRWWSDDPFTVMFQAVLVQNTSWGSVEKTCAAIGEKLTPQTIADLSPEELESLIRPCGFYKSKARTIQTLVAWFQKYDFERRHVRKVSSSDVRKELLSIRGIGAETADVILVYAFYRPSFIVDAYTRRFLLRFGYQYSDDTVIKQFFEKSLPKDAQVYGWYHWLMLEHCIAVCKKHPKCDCCCFQKECRQNL